MIHSDTATPTPDPASGARPAPVIGERDIVFTCPACTGELVVDRDGAGLTVPCSHCGEPITIPPYTPRAAAGQPSREPAPSSSPTGEPAPNPARHFDFSGQTAEQIERRLLDLQHQLKENRSQDTEMRGHVNRATMELHRLQLRLKKLQERQADIEAEVAAIEALPRDAATS